GRRPGRAVTGGGAASSRQENEQKKRLPGTFDRSPGGSVLPGQRGRRGKAGRFRALPKSEKEVFSEGRAPVPPPYRGAALSAAIALSSGQTVASIARKQAQPPI